MELYLHALVVFKLWLCSMTTKPLHFTRVIHFKPKLFLSCACFAQNRVHWQTPYEHSNELSGPIQAHKLQQLSDSAFQEFFLMGEGGAFF